MALSPGVGAALASAGGGILGNLIQAGTSLINSKQQRNENQKDREFNSLEAQKQREFEERMYQQYESPIAQVNQRKQAGLSALDGVTSQSVGSGSTASSSSSALPGIQLSTEWMSELPMMVQQIKAQKLANIHQQGLNEQQSIDKSIKEEQLKDLQLKNARQAFENGKLEEWYKAEYNSLIARAETEKWTKKKLDAEIEQLNYINIQAKEFVETGGNTFKDQSALTQSQTELNKAYSALSSEQKEQVKWALDLSKMFDEQFMNLNLQEREQQVKEFLNANAIFRRDSMRKLIHDMAYNDSEIKKRLNILSEDEFIYQHKMWEEINNAIVNGEDFSKATAILAGYLAKNPQMFNNLFSTYIDLFYK